MVKTVKILKSKTPKNAKSLIKCSVIGCGSWGLAIAGLLARNGYLVEGFSHQKTEDAQIKQLKLNNLPTNFISNDFKLAINQKNYIFIATPSTALQQTIINLKAEQINPKTIIVICSKGLCYDNLNQQNITLSSNQLEKHLPKNSYAILSGPNFATEVTSCLPTITTIASKQAKIAKQVANLLKNQQFLPIISSDIISAQIFAIIKNIVAIGCGVIEGLKLGENAKAALVLKGVIETNLFCQTLGGKPQKNFISACGLGDFFLTCSSLKSRNNSLGLLIGGGEKITNILKQNTTFEGFAAASLIVQFAKQNQIQLPLCQAINQILQGNFSQEQIKQIIIQSIL